MKYIFNPLGEWLVPCGTSSPPPEPSGGSVGFWYYLEKDTSLNFGPLNSFTPFSGLISSFNSTGVDLTADSEFVVPKSGMWMWEVYLTVSGNYSVNPGFNLNGINLPAMSGSWVGIYSFSEGDKVQAGFVVENDPSASPIPFNGGLMNTYFCMKLLLPARG